jgi:hypothetical protein
VRTVPVDRDVNIGGVVGKDPPHDAALSLDRPVALDGAGVAGRGRTIARVAVGDPKASLGSGVRNSDTTKPIARVVSFSLKHGTSPP